MSCDTLNIREELKRLERPSQRDLEIYDWVVGRNRVQVEVADLHQLSQARVSQIVTAVRAWMIDAGGEEMGELPPQLALRYAGRVVRMRLENLLETCMTCFSNSQLGSEQEIDRERETGRTRERIKRSSHGDPRWLMYYQKIALTLARLDGVQTAPKIEYVAEPDAAMVARVVQGLLRQTDESVVAAAEAEEWARDEEAGDELLAKLDAAAARAAEAAKVTQLAEETVAAENELLEREQRLELEAFVAAVELSRANRPAEVFNADQLAHENDLYSTTQSRLQADRDARKRLAEIEAHTGVSNKGSRCEAPLPSVDEALKTPYKVTPPAAAPVPANAPVHERRRAFLSGQAIGDVA